MRNILPRLGCLNTWSPLVALFGEVTRRSRLVEVREFYTASHFLFILSALCLWLKMPSLSRLLPRCPHRHRPEAKINICFLDCLGHGILSPGKKSDECPYAHTFSHQEFHVLFYKANMPVNTIVNCFNSCLPGFQF